MNVNEIFDRLATGHLSNLNLANETSGEIEAEYRKKLINYTNSGLLRLFTRFVVYSKEVMIECQAHITSYELDSRFSHLNHKVSCPYIMDWPHDKFEDDAIKILGVFSAHGKYALNDPGNKASMFTPKPLILQVPNPIQGMSITVEYQARHQKLINNGKDTNTVLNQCVNIPFYLEEPLLNFIASEYYSHLNGQENTAKGQEFFQKYDALCIEIEKNDLGNQTYAQTSEKFDKRGFQ